MYFVDFVGRASRYHLDDSPLLQRLADSEVEFHLTGSRYRGTARPDSDFDFFAEADADGGAIWTALAAMGFDPMPASSYDQCYDDDRHFTVAVLENADDADGVPALLREHRVVDDEHRLGPADQPVGSLGEDLLEWCGRPGRGR